MRSMLYLIGALLGLGLGKALGPDLFALMLRDPLTRMSVIGIVGIVALGVAIHRIFKDNP